MYPLFSFGAIICFLCEILHFAIFGGVFVIYRIDLDVELMLIFAYIAGQVSLRSEKKGTWFTQALCEVFLASAHVDSLDVLIEKV